MELSDLKKIGLTEGEIKLYSALLDLGESTRTELAKKSGISPSKIYDVANRLLEKGIIASVKKNGVIHFSAADPERIKDFIQSKEQEIEKEKKLVDEMLPILLAKYSKTKEETDVEVFYGWEGMKTIFDNKVKEMDKGESEYIFGASKGYDSKQADIFFSQYYLKKKKKGFGSKIIFNEDVRKNTKRTSIFREKPNEMRFLHQDTFTEINLYKNTVLIIMLLKQPIVIRVKNNEAAVSFKKFFDTLWNMAKP
ncbi:helix-turn-helix domain-containing protein [Candidatus Woesearchaeota archaeon]|nr:helix-turn-helix domain-containing protein [Candidatus Woesearchaeota archaeon]